MGGFGVTELVIILVIIMIIFGAGKIPEIGRSFGKTIKNFKTSMKDDENPPPPVEVSQIADAEATPRLSEANQSEKDKPVS